MVFKLHGIKWCFILLPNTLSATQRKYCPHKARQEFTRSFPLPIPRFSALSSSNNYQQCGRRSVLGTGLMLGWVVIPRMTWRPKTNGIMSTEEDIVGLIDLQRKGRHSAFTYSIHEIPSHYHLAYKHLAQMAVYFSPQSPWNSGYGAWNRGRREKWLLRHVFFPFFPKKHALWGSITKYWDNYDNGAGETP